MNMYSGKRPFWLKPLAAAVLAFTVLATIPAGAEFVHPGVAHSRDSIQTVRAKLKAGEQPWTDAWTKLESSREASLDWRPEPRANVERGPSNNPNIGSSEFSSDATAAYVHAVCWSLTDDERHALKSAEIMDAWSGTLESIGNHDARLLIGMSGYKFCIAAELIRHTWDGWPDNRQARFERMLRDVWYPVIRDFYPSANGNWDASMLQAMMAMGVFLDDQSIFDRAREYFLDGDGNGAIGNYFSETGQCQESGRDQGHTQMGLEYLSNTCETAWVQGIDLYGALDNRLLKGFEYTAKYNLGHDVPYEPYRSYEGRYYYKSISEDARGRLRPMYEKVFNHYVNRERLKAAFSAQAAQEQRSRRSRSRRSKSSRSESSRSRSRSRDSSSVPIDTLMFSGIDGAPPDNPGD